MKKVALLALAAFLFYPSAEAQQPAAKHHLFARVAVGIGSSAKRTFYTDVKKHPVAWGLPLALQIATAFADTGSSCVNAANGGYERGPARFIIGRYPNCRKLVTLTSVVMFAHVSSENWLANSFKEKCDREAAQPDSRWWKIDAHTHSTSGCYWGLPWADTGAFLGYEIPVIKANTELQ